MTKTDSPPESGYNCFTDGSKTRKGVGVGACLYKDGNLITEAGEPMNQHNTVFQAETTAMLLACELINDNTHPGDKVIIHTDSQATLLSLEKHKIEKK